MTVAGTTDDKMAIVFKELRMALSEYLGSVLPRLRSDGWWKDAVLANLTHNQRQRLRHLGGSQLSILDLPALLRVFDANWWDLSKRESLSPDCRLYLKELQPVCNRWAHAGAAPEDRETIYRDLDTAQRLLASIAPEHHLIDALSELKEEFSGASCERPGDETKQEQSLPIKSADTSKHATAAPAVGTLVSLKSDPTKTGAVIESVAGHSEGRYTVFMDGKKRQFYASQIVAIDEASSEPVEVSNAEEFHARLSATQLVHPGVSALFSLNSARVDFIPYQFRPVIKFIRADRPRLLIADSVGVGKTIEAGLILRELQARRDVRTVLIVCPKPLVAERKWQAEMLRFDERFSHLDGPRLRNCIEETDLEGVLSCVELLEILIPLGGLRV